MNNFDCLSIHVLYRDVNGNRNELTARSRDAFYNMLLEEDVLTEEDEILFITWGTMVIYNQLMDGQPGRIVKEDLLGFFA